MNTKTSKNFHIQLRNLLAVSDLTAAELADALGLTVPLVNRWLSGTSAPDIYQFQEIARFFEVPCRCLLGCGGPRFHAAELAEQLGLREDTVERLMDLVAEGGNDAVLDALDSVLDAALGVKDGVCEDLERYALGGYDEEE